MTVRDDTDAASDDDAVAGQLGGEPAHGVSSGSFQSATVALHLSGGGYRATMFSAGALLAVADADLAVVSITSVSGGSIASAGTLGGFTRPTPEEPDPMGLRVSNIAELVRSPRIAFESLLGTVKNHIGLAIVLMLAFAIFAIFSAPGSSQVLGGVAAALGLAAVGIIAALVKSWYGVQSAVERITVGKSNSGGVQLREMGTLEALPSPRSIRRVFCATNLKSGEHEYLASETGPAPGPTSRSHATPVPSIYAADAVAASACFPGLGPVVFKAKELHPSDRDGGARRRPIVRRALLEVLPVVLVISAVLAFSASLTGSGPWWAAIALIGCGLVVGLLSFRLLRLSDDDAVLVDGGVWDNLGAMFDSSATDRGVHSPNATASISLVIDASKPLLQTAGKKHKFSAGQLIPLRARAATRTVVKLLANANESARRRVIEYLFDSGSVRGAIVSIRTLSSVDSFDARAGRNFADIPTTLNALSWRDTAELLWAGYRSTRAELTRLGVPAGLSRTADDVKLGLVPPRVIDLGEVRIAYPNFVPAPGSEWRARRLRFERRLGMGVHSSRKNRRLDLSAVPFRKLESRLIDPADGRIRDEHLGIGVYSKAARWSGVALNIFVGLSVIVIVGSYVLASV